MDSIFHCYLKAAPRSKAIAYYRFATDDPGSITAQRDRARAFAEKYNVDIIHEEIDCGKSGNDITRSGLKNIFWDWILNADAPPFEYVLIDDISRWGRSQNPRQIEWYEWLCSLQHREVIYTSTFSLTFPI